MDRPAQINELTVLLNRAKRSGSEVIAGYDAEHPAHEVAGQKTASHTPA